MAREPVLISLVRRSAAQARYVLTGSLLLLGGFQVVIAGQASAIESAQSFGRMAEFVPAFLQRGLGSKAMLLASFKGTIAFGYFHPIVCVLVSVLAAYVTTEPAHDVESGLVDLVLARPIQRRHLVTRSVLLASIAVVAAALVMASGTWLGLRLFASPAFDAPSPSTAARLLLHLAGVACSFGALGLALAAGARRWSTAFTTVTLTIVVLYLLDFLAIAWRPMRSIVWISPFHYYPALSILAGDAPHWTNVAILFSAAAVLTGVAYWHFGRRDL
jgi:ABC-type transport system involved in multi-copper enzyme maturation permease subunit